MRIGVDSGGTFTDIVIADAKGVRLKKVPSTPDDPSRAILKALDGIDAAEVVHGTTVATNALLERKFARAGLVTHRGFEDLLDLGRQNRSQLHDLEPVSTVPLIPAADRFGLTLRRGPGGKEVLGVDLSELSSLRQWVLEKDLEAIAVGFLHSTENGSDEDLVAQLLEDLDLPVVLSHQVAAEPREWERFSTATAAAVLAPVMGRYLQKLAQRLSPAQLRIMDSAGSARPWSGLVAEPVKTVLSGPAGGVMAAQQSSDGTPAITFDMGGTSTDVCLVGGAAHRFRKRNTFVDGIPIAVPMMDIHTVGAGGGSVAWLDAGGAMRVGPQSAGADPGPAAYGRGGDRATVTDAHVVLGRLPKDALLGEQTEIDAEASRQVIDQMARLLDWSSERVALGIIDVANHEMERALRKVSQERGQDPGETTLVCFGGAGALHAVELARSCGIPRVRVPAGAGCFSAMGLLQSPWCEQSEAVLLKELPEQWDSELEQLAETLQQQALMKMPGVELQDVQVDRFLRARHQGQSHDLEIEPGNHPASSFRDRYEEQFGYRMPDRMVEGVALRVSLTSRQPRESFVLVEKTTSGEEARVFLNSKEGYQLIPRIGQGSIVVGETLHGPLLIEGWTTFTWIPRAASVTVDDGGDLWIKVSKG
ncbi:hypothetical protein CBD41_00995 [bacterium TMED181]|nr:5-oxoprolinase [Planctomycetota bacterium]OUW47415.1 MAG: hypothetical protein CBD41_00995 [bacterium TMED181]